MRVADYKELQVYRLAFDPAMEIFQFNRKFPSAERFSLTDQIRRSSRSVCANIAAAWRKRRYEAALVSRLSDGDEQAGKTEVHLDFALQCSYLSPETHTALRDRYDHICAQLTKMKNDPGSWCGTRDDLREIPADYFVQPSERQNAEASKRDTPARYTQKRSPRSERSSRPVPPRP